VNVNLDTLLTVLDALRAEIRKVIIGQEAMIDHALIAILANQHVLIEGVPGIGKTLLVRTLARVLGADFARIQFTPDLMPADITGTHVYNLKSGQFDLLRGPVFTAFLLADEINRAPAKTQSALLQAMQERRVTIDRETLQLASHFTVFATQNPVEYEGTYPLPEAQRDRFMMKINMGLPLRETELELAKRFSVQAESPESVLDEGDIQAVIVPEDLEKLRMSLEQIRIKDELLTYLVDVVRRTREHESVLVGAGPRATQSLILGCRGLAAIAGRDFVTPDDIRNLATVVMGHRMILRPEYEIEGLQIEEVIGEVLDSVAVPR